MQPKRLTPRTDPAGIHESTTCDAGLGGGVCELCGWVNERQERRESDNEQGREEPVVVTISAVRAVIADVIDRGCTCNGNEEPHPWELNDDEANPELSEEYVTAQRVRFLDAVERRLREGGR